jgi:hypothetical protein
MNLAGTWSNDMKVYVLQLDGEVVSVHTSPEAAKERAKIYRHPADTWTEHDSHGLCWECGPYLISEQELDNLPVIEKLKAEVLQLNEALQIKDVKLKEADYELRRCTKWYGVYHVPTGEWCTYEGQVVIKTKDRSDAERLCVYFKNRAGGPFCSDFHVREHA